MKGRSGKICRFFCLIIIQFCFYKTISAQDVHLSQQLSIPVFFNPANTVNSPYDWRIMDNYRSQWSSLGEAYKTNIFGFDKKIYPFNQQLGIGAVMIYDKSGDGKLSNFSTYLNLAYQKKISNYKLALGTQLGYVNKNFDLSTLSFPQQYDRNKGGFNQQLSSGESFVSQYLNYFDMNFGVLIQRDFSSDFSLIFGLSNFHINKPTASFFNQENRKASYYNWQFYAKYQLNKQFELLPFVTYSFESKASKLMLGSDLRSKMEMNIQNIDYWLLGLYIRSGFYRNFDAAIAKAGLEFGRFEVGISYDFTLSALRRLAAYRGGLEFSVILKGPSPQLKFKTIPCERL